MEVETAQKHNVLRVWRLENEAKMSSNATILALLRNLKRDLSAVREEARSKNGIRVPDASQNLSSFCK